MPPCRRAVGRPAGERVVAAALAAAESRLAEACAARGSALTLLRKLWLASKMQALVRL